MADPPGEGVRDAGAGAEEPYSREGLPSHPFALGYSPRDNLLEHFYIPALQRAVRYDRIAGYFSSGGLAVAAQGLAHFIHNGGRMRLLCGAQLSPKDVEAVRRGEDPTAAVERALVGSLPEVEDLLLRDRLGALAWMVARGTLEIRVCLPVDEHRRPLPPETADRYFHAKEGLLRDAQGNELHFIGSGNESIAGWKDNYEVIQVMATWDRQLQDGTIPAVPEVVDQGRARFDRLWEGREEDWIVMGVPAAARDRLLTFVPDEAPTRDPLEPPDPGIVPVPPPPPGPEDVRDLLRFRFIRDAPFLPDAEGLGVATSPVDPWPHQRRVIFGSIRRFPANRLFADEVGLGKTIEAGLALRQLVISGRVRRALLLVPRSVLRQWQEELHEKCVLDVPRYEGGQLIDVLGQPVQGNGDPSPWNRVPLLLASSQLAKRRDRQLELVAAEPWDLVLVDEAHHARRKGGSTEEYRPNRLLELLEGGDRHPGLRTRTQALYLLSATPMQVHPVEVWDLLRLLGLGGRWGASERNFLRFFEELRKGPDDRDWHFLLNMTRDELQAGGEVDPDFETAARKQVGPILWKTIRGLPEARDRGAILGRLDTVGLAVAQDFVHRHTPVRRLVWRNTRALLKRYAREGRIQETVPDRDPRNIWVPMTPEERSLYDRIEEYIADFYRQYEERRKGTGFIMTVYRRRLTSSFEAIRKSLARRLEFLRGQVGASALVSDEDVEQEELSEDFWEEDSEEAQGERARYLPEIEYVEDFLRELGALGSDSKVERLKTDIADIFRMRHSVIVFTQYTDTMDHLREELRAVYGSQVACYSGRGGERWNGFGWVEWEKEELKEAFRGGHDVRILLCTESASEGLNLQTCGVLINFDMPWNPMRVEQRIGRIDRIGQKYDEVWIYNYFYEETVEAIVYQRLSDRIDWFEQVVGELQPILHRVGWLIQRLALLPPGSREAELLRELKELREELEKARTAAFKLDEELDEKLPPDLDGGVPVTQADIEEAFLQSSRWGPLFTPYPAIAGAHRLRWRGEHRVTFRPEVFDRHPYQVQLLTYGNPLFHDLVKAAAGGAEGPDRGGQGGGGHDEEAVRRLTDDGPPPVALYVTPAEEGIYAIRRMDDLPDRTREVSPEWDVPREEAAQRLLDEARSRVRYSLDQEHRARQEAERLTLVERARDLLVRAALVEAVRREAPELGDHDGPAPRYGTEGVLALARHGIPFKGLLTLVADDPPSVSPADPRLSEFRGKGRGALDQVWEGIRREGMGVLKSVRR